MTVGHTPSRNNSFVYAVPFGFETVRVCRDNITATNMTFVSHLPGRQSVMRRSRGLANLSPSRTP
jgi:hypothetical protein